MKIKAIIGILLSILCLFLAFRNVDLVSIFSTITAINSPVLAISVIIILIGQFLKAARWRHLLDSETRERFINIFSVMMVGYLGNNILPARMGELLKVYTLNKNYGYSKSQTIATILVEKIFDILIILFSLGAVALFFPFPSIIKKSGVLLGAGVAGIIIFLYLLKIKKPILLRFVEFITSPLQNKSTLRIKSILDNFDTGLMILKNKNEIGIIFIYSVAIWLNETIFAYSVFLAFNLQLSILAAVFLTMMLTLGMLIPSSPGSIGILQIMAITALAPFGVEKVTALSISIVLQILILSVTTIIGALCLWRENVKPSQVDYN